MKENPKGVTFTHESAAAYAEIELTGLYLYAARIFHSKLAPYKAQIDHLVDFGSGAGKSSRGAVNCVSEGGLITGVELSPDMIQQAERLTAEASIDGARFQYKQIKNGIIPLADECADAVISCAVLQEIQTLEELGATIKEIGRITRADGNFVAVVPNEHLRDEDFVSVTYKPYPENLTRKDNIRVCRSTEAPIVWERDRHWTKEEYGDLLRRVGFEVLSLEYPLAGPSEPPYPNSPEIPWKDELRISPALVFHARKKSA